MIRPRIRRNGNSNPVEATSLQTIRAVANELSGLRMTINALSQKTEQVLSLADTGELDEQFLESKLAKHANIQSALLAEYTEVFEKFQSAAKRVLLEMLRLGVSDIRECFDKDGNLIPVSELPDDIAASIASVKVHRKKIIGMKDANGEPVYADSIREIKLWDKTKALGLLGKHFGLLKDIVEHTGPGGGPVKVDVTAQPIPLDKLSLEGKRQMLAILVREGIVEGAIDVESRLLEEETESSREDESNSISRVAAFPFAD